MAGADYKSCDVCGGKAFYDADLGYSEDLVTISTPFLVVGKPQYGDEDLLSVYGQSLGYLGDWAVICTDCSPRFKTQIVPV